MREVSSLLNTNFATYDILSSAETQVKQSPISINSILRHAILTSKETKIQIKRAKKGGKGSCVPKAQFTTCNRQQRPGRAVAIPRLSVWSLSSPISFSTPTPGFNSHIFSFSGTPVDVYHPRPAAGSWGWARPGAPSRNVVFARCRREGRPGAAARSLRDECRVCFEGVGFLLLVLLRRPSLLWEDGSGVSEGGRGRGEQKKEETSRK